MQDRLDWVVVVGADTIVELDGQILEKPGTAEKAKHMLQRSGPFISFHWESVWNTSDQLVTGCFTPSISLSGHTHIVHTGVTLVWRGGGGVLQERGFHETTEVTFTPLSEEVLQSYIASGEPL